MDDQKKQFRRFTYFSNTGSGSNPVAFALAQLDRTRLREFGVFDVEGYHKENQYFFIVDAEPTLNHADIKMAFSGKEDADTANELSSEKNLILPLATAPLERIYELDQERTYAAKDGQLKSGIGPHKRFVWTLLLQEDPKLMAEYRKAHAIGAAWPQISKNMKQVGVMDMEIYLYGTQAILIMDTRPDFELEKVGPVWQDLPREGEWQDYVAKFQRTRPGSSIQEKWQDMGRVDVKRKT